MEESTFLCDCCDGLHLESNRGVCSCILAEYIAECNTYDFCKDCGCPMSCDQYYDPEELLRKNALEEAFRQKRLERKRKIKD